MSTKRKAWSKAVEEHGVKVRIFERTAGGVLYLEVRGVEGRADGKERTSLKHRDRQRAEDEAVELCRAVAELRITGAANSAPGGLTLGQLFAQYRRHRLPQLNTARQREAERLAVMFVAAWSRDMPVADIDPTRVAEYCRKRRALEVLPQSYQPDENGKLRRGYRAPKPMRDGQLDFEFRWLRSVLNWAVGFRTNGRRLLADSPLRGVAWPKERNPRRPVASHQRYLATLDRADAVDAKGRLRCILALARYTGRRESAVCALFASDLLLSPERIRSALAAAGMDERLAEHMPHGAIRWRAETDKKGFLFVSPISAPARAEVDRYVQRAARVGDVPLFPAPRQQKPKSDAEPLPEQPIRSDTAGKWLLKAERLAELPKLVGGVFHPYRRLWASERRHLPDVDVAAAGGWRDTQALRISYQHADAAGVLRVVEGA